MLRRVFVYTCWTLLYDIRWRWHLSDDRHNSENIQNINRRVFYKRPGIPHRTVHLWECHASKWTVCHKHREESHPPASATPQHVIAQSQRFASQKNRSVWNINQNGCAKEETWTWTRQSEVEITRTGTLPESPCSWPIWTMGIRQKSTGQINQSAIRTQDTADF